MGPGYKSWPYRRDDIVIAPVFFLLGVLCLLSIGPAKAEPYIPASTDVVLATVAPAAIAERRRIQGLQDQLGRDPANNAAALSLVDIYSAINEQSGDPRYLGYAQSVIDSIPTPHSSQIKLQQARLMQARHEFSNARQLLTDIVNNDASLAEAWSMLASLATLQADYDIARNACARLGLAGHTERALVCGTELVSLTGQSTRALVQLEQQLPAINDSQVASWAYQVAADIALRLGKTSVAMSHSQQALTLDDSLYNVIQLSDILIGEGEFAEALALLASRPRVDAILLREARASLAAQDRYDTSILQGRVEKLTARGDDAHAREEAYFHVYVLPEGAAAVDAAQRNWATQRERIDAELLLQAARLDNNPAAAAPVIEWMQSNGSDDIGLQRLAGLLR